SGDLIVDHHFEFAGAGEGAFEPVTKGIDFAAHSLTHGSDLVGGGYFGFGQANGGLGDGGGGVAQILGATDERRNSKEAEHRQDDDGEDGDEFDRAGELSEIGHFRTVAQHGNGHASGDPE